MKAHRVRRPFRRIPKITSGTSSSSGPEPAAQRPASTLRGSVGRCCLSSAGNSSARLTPSREAIRFRGPATPKTLSITAGGLVLSIRQDDGALVPTKAANRLRRRRIDGAFQWRHGPVSAARLLLRVVSFRTRLTRRFLKRGRSATRRWWLFTSGRSACTGCGARKTPLRRRGASLLEPPPPSARELAVFDALKSRRASPVPDSLRARAGTRLRWLCRQALSPSVP